MSPPNWYDLRPLPVSTGAWIAARLVERNTVSALLPSGFEAYAVLPHGAKPAGERLGPRLARPLREVLGRHTMSRTLVAGLWCGFGDIDGGTTKGTSGTRTSWCSIRCSRTPIPTRQRFRPR